MTGLRAPTEGIEVLLDHFPSIDFSFAYGSGVLQQAGYDPLDRAPHQVDYRHLPMLDLVLAVSNPVEWHRQNLERNRHHYSFLKYTGPERIATLQEKYGAAMYYNTAVRVPDTFQGGRLMKYGVISTAALRDDLLNWTHIYAAGRLHKPVRVLRPHELLEEPRNINLLNALKVALLLLPEHFTDTQLFTMIAGLSYRGDFRMTFGENPRKVRNIVAAGLPHFKDLYRSILPRLPYVTSTCPDSSRFSQDIDPSLRSQCIQTLPVGILGHLQAKPRDWRDMSARRSARLVRLAVHQTVARSSFVQSVKGILTAGIYKAVLYGVEKIHKMHRASGSR